MASEWAREKVEQIVKLAECIHADDCGEPYGEGPCTCWVEEVWQEIAAALDEARAEGRKEALGSAIPLKDLITEALAEARREAAERERWECHRIAAETPDECGEYWRSCKRCGAHIADAIAARGPMRGPEEE